MIKSQKVKKQESFNSCLFLDFLAIIPNTFNIFESSIFMDMMYV